MTIDHMLARGHACLELEVSTSERGVGYPHRWISVSKHHSDRPDAPDQPLFMPSAWSNYQRPMKTGPVGEVGSAHLLPRLHTRAITPDDGMRPGSH